jgi:PAS domain-containing protein
MSERRVVITGIGCITPLGNDLSSTWSGLKDGRSGIATIANIDPSPFDCRIAGEVKNFEPKRYMDFKEARRMSRCSQLAVATAREAMRDAGFADGTGTAASFNAPYGIVVFPNSASLATADAANGRVRFVNEAARQLLGRGEEDLVGELRILARRAGVMTPHIIDGEAHLTHRDTALVLRAAGLKFGRWVDVVYLQRSLGAGDRDVPDRP